MCEVLNIYFKCSDFSDISDNTVGDSPECNDWYFIISYIYYLVYIFIFKFYILFIYSYLYIYIK